MLGLFKDKEIAYRVLWRHLLLLILHILLVYSQSQFLIWLGTYNRLALSYLLCFVILISGFRMLSSPSKIFIAFCLSGFTYRGIRNVENGIFRLWGVWGSSWVYLLQFISKSYWMRPMELYSFMHIACLIIIRWQKIPEELFELVFLPQFCLKM